MCCACTSVRCGRLAISVSSDGIALITSRSFSLLFPMLMKKLTFVGKIETSQYIEHKGRKAVQTNVAEYTPAVDYWRMHKGFESLAREKKNSPRA